MYLTRFCKLPEHDAVIISRAIDKIFEDGTVYGVKKVLGEYIIAGLGKSKICDTDNTCSPNKHSEMGSIMLSGTYLLTDSDCERGR